MKKKISLIFLLFIGIYSYSQAKTLPAGWDEVLLDDKIAYMNLITGTVSKTYPKKPALKPLQKLEFDPTINHKVKKGETLSTISRKYDLKLSRLYRLNGLTNFDTLKIGQEVVIGYGQSEAEKTAFWEEIKNKKNKKAKLENKTKDKTALNPEFAKRFQLIVEKEPTTQKKVIAKKVKKAVEEKKVITKKVKEPITEKKVIAEKMKKTMHSYHTVKASETLYAISVYYKQPIDTLKALNNLKDNNIFMGQKLRVK